MSDDCPLCLGRGVTILGGVCPCGAVVDLDQIREGPAVPQGDPDWLKRLRKRLVDVDDDEPKPKGDDRSGGLNDDQVGLIADLLDKKGY